MKVNLYMTPSCAKCMLVKKYLKQADIEYTLVDDAETVLIKATKIGKFEMPLLEIDDNVYSGLEAVTEAKCIAGGLGA